MFSAAATANADASPRRACMICAPQESLVTRTGNLARPLEPVDTQSHVLKLRSLICESNVLQLALINIIISQRLRRYRSRRRTRPVILDCICGHSCRMSDALAAITRDVLAPPRSASLYQAAAVAHAAADALTAKITRQFSCRAKPFTLAIRKTGCTILRPLCWTAGLNHGLKP